MLFCLFGPCTAGGKEGSAGRCCPSEDGEGAHSFLLHPQGRIPPRAQAAHRGGGLGGGGHAEAGARAWSVRGRQLQHCLHFPKPQDPALDQHATGLQGGSALGPGALCLEAATVRPVGTVHSDTASILMVTQSRRVFAVTAMQSAVSEGSRG